MEFAAENFPLYQILQQNNFPGADAARADFEKAAKGGSAEKYEFAMGLFTVTQVPDISKKVSAITPAVIDTTKEQVYLIFAEGAEQGNADSAMMAAFMKATGQGTPEDREGAMKLVAQAESIAGPTPFSTELKRQLTPATYTVPGKRPGF